LILDLDLPNELAASLEQEAARCRMTIADMAAEFVEIELAARRLPFVDDSPRGGRHCTWPVGDAE
jgi:hypothetical protein